LLFTGTLLRLLLEGVVVLSALAESADFSGETKGLVRVLETLLSLRRFAVRGEAMLSLLRGQRCSADGVLPQVEGQRDKTRQHELWRSLQRARVHLRHHASHFPIVDDCLARDGCWMRRRSDLPY
jgi:hypothetical protein